MMGWQLLLPLLAAIAVKGQGGKRPSARAVPRAATAPKATAANVRTVRAIVNTPQGRKEVPLRVVVGPTKAVSARPASPERQAIVDAAVAAPSPTTPPTPPVASPDVVMGRTPAQAAQQLAQYVRETGSNGKRGDAIVASLQRDLDSGLKPDGIVGPKTRAAAKRHGVVIPQPKGVGA